ncbi:hypothetical protein LINPERPRIM_LOCUS36466, partial [Linum perenne]
LTRFPSFSDDASDEGSVGTLRASSNRYKATNQSISSLQSFPPYLIMVSSKSRGVLVVVGIGHGGWSVPANWRRRWNSCSLVTQVSMSQFSPPI